MKQGKKMPAGAGNLGGRMQSLLHHEIVTQLGGAPVWQILAVWAAVLGLYLVGSGGLWLGYLIAKGMVF